MHKRYIFAVLAIVLGLSRVGSAQPLARDDAKVIRLQRMWMECREGGGAVSYELSGRELKWDRAADPNGSPDRYQLSAKGLLRCSQFAMSMEFRRTPTQRVVLLLDNAAFHAWRSGGQSGPTVADSQGIQADSDFVYLLPLALAYGIVPLDPLQLKEYFGPKESRHGPVSSGGTSPLVTELHINLEPSPRRVVTIECDSDGSVKQMQWKVEDSPLLQVRNSYGADGTLQSFSIVAFTESGKVARRFDGKVTKAEKVEQLRESEFAVPRAPQELQRLVLAGLQKPVTVSDRMNLEEIAARVEEALGGKLPLRVLKETFEDPRASVDIVREFASGEETVSSVLFEHLREIGGVDFCLTHNGLAILSRNAAWELAEIREYQPPRYGLSSEGLKDLLFHATVLDDWADMGGLAKITIDEKTGGVVVFQCQSDHLRFSQTLQPLLLKREGERPLHGPD